MGERTGANRGPVAAAAGAVGTSRLGAVARVAAFVLGVVPLGMGVGAGCFSPSVPDPKTNGAGAPCNTSSECRTGFFCMAGPQGSVCAPPGSVPQGGRCAATRDCQPGFYCAAAGLCAPAGMALDGATCGSDGDCLAGHRCLLDGLTGVCGPAGITDTGGACASNVECLAGLWCTPDRGCQPLGIGGVSWPGVTCRDEGAFRSYFEVPRPGKPPADFFRLPFPNDVRVDGGVVDLSDFPRPGPSPLGPDLVQTYVDAWTADFDGFGSSVPVTFRFSDQLDIGTITGATVHLIDVTPPSTSGSELGRLWSTNPGGGKYVCRNSLRLGPLLGDTLRGGHTYVAYVSAGVKSQSGVAALPDADLLAVLAGEPPAAAAVDPALAHAWQVYAPFRRWLAAAGIATSTIVNASVFTVADAPGHLARLAQAVAAQPAPRLAQVTACGAGVVSPCDDGTAARACPAAADPAFTEIHGKMPVPIYQQGTPPYAAAADGGGIVEVAGVPQLARVEDVCFALSVPGGAAPAAGWPLAVYHHGTGGSMRSFVSEGIAGKLAALAPAVAVLSFDAVEHGARRGGSTKAPEDLVFNLVNPRAARDNFLQGAADIWQALRVAGMTVPLGTGTIVKLDPAKVTFFGHSQGATSGELALPYTAAVGAAVLSGAGAWLTASLLHKTSPRNIDAGIELLVQETLDESHPVMVLFQSYFERSDPLNTNRLIVTAPRAGVPPKHVYMSWGDGDTYTPSQTQEANALSLGLPLVAPGTSPHIAASVSRPVRANYVSAIGGSDAIRTAAVFQYATAGYDGHFVAQQNPDAVRDWTAFLQSYLTTGTPAVP